MRLRPSLLLGLAVLAACARAPIRLQGEFPPTTVADAQRGDHVGERVRWGGAIVATSPEREQTCVEIVSRPLDPRARPRPTDETYGRFRTCAPGFYDPQIYAAGRDVTVVGTLEGTRAGKVGDYTYPFPLVAAETIHLWPERQDEWDVYGPGPASPWWGWYELPFQFGVYGEFPTHHCR